MGKLMDLTGVRFGRLVVISLYDKNNGNAKWLCKCDCGNETIAQRGNLRQGTTQSCGCLAKELARSRLLKHGMYGTRLYTIWTNMKQRCYNDKHQDYDNYGGRGVSIYKQWIEFDNFYQWAITHGYNDSLTIDRTNVDGNYDPDNCIWITVTEQNQHGKRNLRLITINNVTNTLAEWSRISGINRATLYSRIKRGWPTDKLLIKHNEGSKFRICDYGITG